MGLVIKQEYYTESEFEIISKDYQKNNIKAELIEGHIYCSSFTSIKHNDIKNNLHFELRKYLKGSKCKSYDEQIEVIFNYDNPNKRHKVKPDLFVMCEDARTSGQSFISSPRVIFEIISKSTRSLDYITKMDLYARFGVQEYVIVEQDGAIYQFVLEEPGQYAEAVYYSVEENNIYNSAVLDGFSVDLNDIFA